MAVHVEVRKINDRGRPMFEIERTWEDGFVEEAIRVQPQTGMTAAESVEWHMLLNLGMVPSWFWDKSSAGILRGQFVVGRIDGKPAHKEVSDSRAWKADL